MYHSRSVHVEQCSHDCLYQYIPCQFLRSGQPIGRIMISPIDITLRNIFLYEIVLCLVLSYCLYHPMPFVLSKQLYGGKQSSRVMNKYICIWLMQTCTLQVKQNRATLARECNNKRHSVASHYGLLSSSTYRLWRWNIPSGWQDYWPSQLRKTYTPHALQPSMQSTFLAKLFWVLCPSLMHPQVAWSSPVCIDTA